MVIPRTPPPDFLASSYRFRWAAIPVERCVQDLKGKRLDNAPDWTVSSFAQFDYPFSGLDRRALLTSLICLATVLPICLLRRSLA